MLNMPKSALKILVVDDQPQNLLALQALLADEQVQVLAANSGPAALELLLSHEVALVLLDIQMPGMDGYALAELLRGTERTRHVPLIFMTAGSREEQRSFRGYEAGAVDFLYKPVEGFVLRSKVAVFVDLHRRRRELSQRMAEFERLTRVNAQMLSAITHDLRPPLAALMLNAELLLRRGEEGGLQGAGERIKAATALMSKQVDHLVNLAQMPCEEVLPQLQPGDLASTVEDSLQAASALFLSASPIAWHLEGDGRAVFDPVLMREAIDHLVLQAITYAGEVPVSVTLDGSARRTLTWRVSYPLSLPDAARAYLLGDTGMLNEGDLQPKVGVGLRRAEEIARAHGGSIVGYSREKEGTLFELVLPRDA
jgi:two-component system, sensor histidine kinase and response regulator